VTPLPPFAPLSTGRHVGVNSRSAATTVAKITVVSVAALLVAAGCSSSGSTKADSGSSQAPSTEPATTAAPGQSGQRGRIVVLIEENHSADQIIGQPELPKLNALAKQGTLVNQFFAITHPSLPNYIALTSGGTQGITSDCGQCDVAADNLGAQLQKAHVTWKVYAQGLPAACDRSPTAGAYAKKHVPFLYYRSVIDDPKACAAIVPFDQFATDAKAGKLPDVAFVIPDLAHDMHGTGEGQDNGQHQIEVRADDFAGQVHQTLMASPAWQQDTRLVVTWDEGGGGQSGPTSCCDGLAKGGHIPTLVVGPKVPAGKDDTTYTTYSLLKSIEQRYGLPLLGHAADAQTKAIPALTQPPRSS